MKKEKTEKKDPQQATWKDAQGFLLSVEYFNKWGDEKYLLVHPQDENEAIDCVEKLMSGVSLHEN